MYDLCEFDKRIFYAYIPGGLPVILMHRAFLMACERQEPSLKRGKEAPRLQLSPGTTSTSTTTVVEKEEDSVNDHGKQEREYAVRRLDCMTLH